MSTKLTSEINAILDERFGHDSLISVATVKDNMPYVRTVDSLYDDGAFYVITHALSGKMQQITENDNVAICGEWFTARGKGENIGHVRAEKNTIIANKLRKAFEAWYSNGHTNEDDPNTCILCIHLTEGVLFSHGTRYDIDFTE